MIESDPRQEEELKSKLYSLEQELDDFMARVRKILSKEEQEEEKTQQEYYRLEEMREMCESDDRELLQLIDDKQEFLRKAKNKRMDFEYDFNQEIKGRINKENQEREDIYRKIREL